jgi:NUBPL iron-transfer P-loop NTPase
VIGFDDALPVVTRELAAVLTDNVSKVTVIRDVVGMLTIVIPDELLVPDKWDALSERLDKQLAPFSPGPRFVLLRESDLIDRDDTINSSVRIQLDSGIWLVDRLITNQDWLQKPSVTKSILPVAVVFSLKGGVGRSTAAAVWSWYLARLGKRTVVIDLDLEAPGLASLLLTELPDRGLVDWMVDNLIAPTSPELLDDILCPSPVADDAPGTIHVIPAFGANTKEYVSKLGRA